ncbi:amidohydrolase family protein [Thermoanaerobacterium sp. DL9XJH110]|uniref:amidohydrolase family protein n=1 Tax=Thermoanaerobacterium sp. DL9XJH110 TaxID=3386643 RepID=UPI003BB7D6ED
MIFDFHVHLGTTSRGKKFSVDDLIAAMNYFGIQKAGLSVLAGVSMKEQNDAVAEAMGKYPDRIVGYGYINPRDPQAIEEVHRCLKDLKMKGIKFHSWKHGYYPDNCLQLHDVIDAIEPYKVPILTHTGTASLSLPQQWAAVAEKHPNATFVFAHIGYYDFGYGCVECAKRLPNVYVETSGQHEIPVLEKALQDLGPERIIFGSDWPYKYIGSEMEKFKCLNLTEDKRRAIFYENARKLWRLEE